MARYILTDNNDYNNVEDSKVSTLSYFVDRYSEKNNEVVLEAVEEEKSELYDRIDKMEKELEDAKKRLQYLDSTQETLEDANAEIDELDEYERDATLDRDPDDPDWEGHL